MQNVLNILPDRISSMLSIINNEKLKAITQIRLRINKPIMVFIGKSEYMISRDGLNKTYGELFSREDQRALLCRLNEHSAYIHNESIKSGYITIQGGHRIGIAGNVIAKNGKIEYISDQAFFCIRCAHQIYGCFDALREELFTNGLDSCLFFSLPGNGKTTLLRECCRKLSNEGYNICLIDERNEISGSFKGEPMLDVGKRCDVFTSCPRSAGIISAVRAMAPDLIITDEIGTVEDYNAIRMAINSGIKIIASIHAGNIENVKAKLQPNDISFDKYIKIELNLHGLTYALYDKEFNALNIRRKRYCCI